MELRGGCVGAACVVASSTQALLRAPVCPPARAPRAAPRPGLRNGPSKSRHYWDYSADITKAGYGMFLRGATVKTARLLNTTCLNSNAVRWGRGSCIVVTGL